MAGTIILGRNVTIQTTESEEMQSTPLPVGTNFTFVGEGDQAGLELWEVPVVTAIIILLLLILVVGGLLYRRRMLRARFRNRDNQGQGEYMDAEMEGLNGQAIKEN